MSVRKKNGKRGRLVVTEEAIRDFVRLSVSQRIQWLDEARAFLIQMLSPKALKRWDAMKEAVGKKAV